MTNRKALNMLGLAMRAGKLATGAFQVNKALEAGKACLLIADADTSAQTFEEYERTAESKGIGIVRLETGELASATGKPGRMLAAVLDENFSLRINDLIHGGV